MKFIKDHLLKRKAQSREHFYKLLMENGFVVKYKHQIPIGIEDTNGRSYSWQKLGISPDDFHHLDRAAQFLQMNDRLKKLEKCRTEQEQDRSPEREH